MTIDYQKLRLDGVYRQNDAGDLMLRVKIPAGILSAPQAEALCALAETYSNGHLHLTCRGSIELHWVEYASLTEIFRQLATVGLTTRGACGGAVRGISCSTPAGPGFGVAQRIARSFHRHFSGNPYFEGLPKKFKISVEAGYDGSRHLIQDLAIVQVNTADNGERFDVWCAGGLGREPQAGVLLKRGIAEAELLPLAEAVIRVYARHAPAGKRLKHLVRAIGVERLKELVAGDISPLQFLAPTLSGELTRDTGVRLHIPVFAGEITSADLRRIAKAAMDCGDGTLVLTADQDIVLFLPDTAALETARRTISDLLVKSPARGVNFRACPGNHECRMGLAPTRDVARAIIPQVPSPLRALTFAVSGCPNSCSQPQLADIGIVCAKLVTNADGSRKPLFDLYRRSDDGLGQASAKSLDIDGLLESIAALR